MNNSNIEIYTTENGKTEIQVKFDKETVWLNQYQLEELFETNRSSITKHISNIYKSEELEKNQLVQKLNKFKKRANAKYLER